MSKKRHRKHTGFWIDVDGQPVHVLGDPEMSKDLIEALADMAREARKMIADPQPANPVRLRDPVSKHEMVFDAGQVKIIELWKSLGYEEVEET